MPADVLTARPLFAGAPGPGPARHWVLLFLGAVVAVLLVGSALPSFAAHCSNTNISTTDDCPQGHTVVDNWPTEYPHAPSSGPSECDEAVALVAVEDVAGCSVRGAGPTDEWRAVFLLGACLMVALVTSLVVGQVRR
jgi:hypothetical protein